jgi:hypothetical protein
MNTFHYILHILGTLYIKHQIFSSDDNAINCANYKTKTVDMRWNIFR